MASRHEGKQPLGQSCSQALERFLNNVAVLPIVTHTQSHRSFQEAKSVLGDWSGSQARWPLYFGLAERTMGGLSHAGSRPQVVLALLDAVFHLAPRAAAGAPLALPPAGPARPRSGPHRRAPGAADAATPAARPCVSARLGSPRKKSTPSG